MAHCTGSETPETKSCSRPGAAAHFQTQKLGGGVRNFPARQYMTECPKLICRRCPAARFLVQRGGSCGGGHISQVTLSGVILRCGNTLGSTNGGVRLWLETTALALVGVKHTSRDIECQVDGDLDGRFDHAHQQMSDALTVDSTGNPCAMRPPLGPVFWPTP